MTAAQKTAKAKFKQAIAYRQKTGVSLKEAFAHIYGKKVGAVKKKVTKKVFRKIVKKAAPKKVAKKKLTSRDYDKRYQAKKPGKRISTGKNYPYIEGNTYYENRANRSDRGKLLGVDEINISYLEDLNKWIKILNERQKNLKFYKEQLAEARKLKANQNIIRYNQAMILNSKILINSSKKHIMNIKKNIK